MDLTKISDIELMSLRAEMGETYQELVKQIAQVDAEIQRRVNKHRNVSVEEKES